MGFRADCTPSDAAGRDWLSCPAAQIVTNIDWTPLTIGPCGVVPASVLNLTQGTTSRINAR